jgi:predicted RNA-binding protein with PUA-like domain
MTPRGTIYRASSAAASESGTRFAADSFLCEPPRYPFSFSVAFRRRPNPLFLLLFLSYTFPMPNAYLLKTEPSEYSFTDLQKDKKTVWDGVHNPVALRNLGEMKPGDHLIVYETGDEKAAVGTASVVSVTVTDSKNPQVEVAAGKALAKPITLAEIKANKMFATSPLVRMGRLSVVPLTPEQYKFLTSS